MESSASMSFSLMLLFFPQRARIGQKFDHVGVNEFTRIVLPLLSGKLLKVSEFPEYRVHYLTNNNCTNFCR